MDGETLINLLISFMDDEEISEPFAYQLLNLAKDNIEMSRPWMKLRSFKADYSFVSSDGYNDFQTLPDNFLMTYGNHPLKLVSGSSVEKFKETPMEDRDENRDRMNVFYIFHNENKFAILGGLSKGYSGTLYFIKRTEDIESGTTWIFPKFSHPLLVIEALIIHRGEVDFDDINARMVKNGFGTADNMRGILDRWDSQLNRMSLRGRNKGDLFGRN